MKNNIGKVKHDGWYTSIEMKHHKTGNMLIKIWIH